MKELIKKRIGDLRQVMKAQKLDAFIIYGTDPHLSEYIPSHWQTRPYISGFTGSAGLVVVTARKAALWTDSRYFLQAESELAGSEIELRVYLILPYNSLGLHPLCKQVRPLIYRFVNLIHAKTMASVSEDMHFGRDVELFQC